MPQLYNGEVWNGHHRVIILGGAVKNAGENWQCVDLPPFVADLLSDEQRIGLEEFEVTHGVEIIVKADSKLHQEHFDISVV